MPGPLKRMSAFRKPAICAMSSSMSSNGATTIAPSSRRFLIAIFLRFDFQRASSLANDCLIAALFIPFRNRSCKIAIDFKNTGSSPLVLISSRIFRMRHAVSGVQSSDLRASGSIAGSPSFTNCSIAFSRFLKMGESSSLSARVIASVCFK